MRNSKEEASFERIKECIRKMYDYKIADDKVYEAANNVIGVVELIVNFKTQKAKAERVTPSAPAVETNERSYNKDSLLTAKEAAEYLGLRENTLAGWRCSGVKKLPYVKVARYVKYKFADLEAFVDSNMLEHTSKKYDGGKDGYY